MNQSPRSMCPYKPRSWIYLAELKRSLSLTLLFIAHDLSMVRYVSDRMAVMYLGSLVEVGRSDRVFFDPNIPIHGCLSVPTPSQTPSRNVRGSACPALAKFPRRWISQRDVDSPIVVLMRWTFVIR
ncbi:MAG: hypothetical protein Ct9H300mP8_00390 [Gammaproteobacteria bacterium]|nr:MAG: hypothetical protein Ct9H300mP8_00390 [Gammaproteobacteria bacterium]